MPSNPNVHYFSATAKLPEDFPSGDIYKYVDIGLIVNVDTREIHSIKSFV